MKNLFVLFLLVFAYSTCTAQIHRVKEVRVKNKIKLKKMDIDSISVDDSFSDATDTQVSSSLAIETFVLEKNGIFGVDNQGNTTAITGYTLGGNMTINGAGYNYVVNTVSGTNTGSLTIIPTVTQLQSQNSATSAIGTISINSGTEQIIASQFGTTDHAQLTIEKDRLTIEAGASSGDRNSIVIDDEAIDLVLPAGNTIHLNGIAPTDGQVITGQADGTVAWEDQSGAGSGSSLWTESGADIYFNTGNVGVGTSTPSQNFHIKGPTGTLFAMESEGNVSYSSYWNTQTGIGLTNGLTLGVNGLNSFIYSRENGNIIFGTNDGADACFDSNGRFLIVPGNTSNGAFGSADADLHINSAAVGTDLAFLTESGNDKFFRIRKNGTVWASNKANTVLFDPFLFEWEDDGYLQGLYGDGNRYITRSELILQNGSGSTFRKGALLGSAEVPAAVTDNYGQIVGTYGIVKNYSSGDVDKFDATYAVTTVGAAYSGTMNQAVGSRINMNTATSTANSVLKAYGITHEATVAAGVVDYAAFHVPNNLSLSNTGTAHAFLAEGNEFNSFMGSVGAGTLAPTEALDVNGNIRLRQHIVDENNETGTTDQVLTRTATGVDWQDASGGSSLWFTNANGIHYASGNVGIGESLPDANLHVDGNAIIEPTSSNSRYVYFGDYDSPITANQALNIYVNSSGTETKFQNYSSTGRMTFSVGNLDQTSFEFRGRTYSTLPGLVRFQCDTPSNDVEPGNIEFTASSARPDATTNQNGADVVFNGGANATGGGLDGDILLASLRGNVGINNTNPLSKFHLTGNGNTAGTFPFIVENSDGNDIIAAKDNGDVAIDGGFNIYATLSLGQSQIDATTSVAKHEISVNRTFAPTTGTANYTGFHYTPVINQTGGANGQSSAIWIEPTLTAAADWKAIYVNANEGYGIYQDGADASNYFEGDVSIGVPTAQEKLHIHENSGGGVGLQVSNNDTGSGANQGAFFGLLSTDVLSINNRFNDDMWLSTNNVIRMTIKDDGKVGIGTTSPSANALLDVNGVIEATNIPPPPSTDGTYTLTVTVTGGVPSYSWQ